MHNVIYLLRHGETDWNAQRRMQGHTDIPLNDSGRAQARAVATAVAALDIDACYASDLSRAYETAELALSLHPTVTSPIVHIPLRERQFGTLEGLNMDEIDAHKSANPDHYIDLDGTGRLFPKNGEPEDVFTARVAANLLHLPLQHKKPVLLVTHGGVIRQMLRDFSPGTAVFQPGNAHLYRFAAQNDHWQITQIWPE